MVGGRTQLAGRGLEGVCVVAALVALHAAGHLPTGQFEFLLRAYRLLRRIEGHLRLLDAPGRHDLPSSPAEQRTLAHLMGHGSAESLVEEIGEVTARTRREFDQVFDTIEAGLR